MNRLLNLECIRSKDAFLESWFEIILSDGSLYTGIAPNHYFSKEGLAVRSIKKLNKKVKVILPDEQTVWVSESKLTERFKDIQIE